MVFDPRVSNGLLRHLAGAINGSAIARGTSFLKDSMGKQILPAALSVIDDPHRKRGMASKPFDAEGLANESIALVEDGVLKSWVLDLRSARQLGLAIHRTGVAGNLGAAVAVDHQLVSPRRHDHPRSPAWRYQVAASTSTS